MENLTVSVKPKPADSAGMVIPREVAIFGKLGIKSDLVGILRKSEWSEFQKVRIPDTMVLMIKDVMDLEVYRESLRLLKKLYLLLRKLPKSEYDTVVQCKRSGKGIPATIAEGWAKRSSELEFKRFLKMAIGSSDELITHLRTIAITTPKLTNEAKEIAEEYKTLSKRLNKLHSIWKSGYF